jgi:predicted amidohydrolase YtcJ
MKYLLSALLPILMTACYQGETADLIIHNATIYSCDENFTVYDAMAIKDGKILQMGPEREILNGYACGNLIDLQNAPVYPGFHDAHC